MHSPLTPLQWILEQCVSSNDSDMPDWAFSQLGHLERAQTLHRCVMVEADDDRRRRPAEIVNGNRGMSSWDFSNHCALHTSSFFTKWLMRRNDTHHIKVPHHVLYICQSGLRFQFGLFWPSAGGKAAGSLKFNCVKKFQTVCSNLLCRATHDGTPQC